MWSIFVWNTSLCSLRVLEFSLSLCNLIGKTLTLCVYVFCDLSLAMLLLVYLYKNCYMTYTLRCNYKWSLLILLHNLYLVKLWKCVRIYIIMYDQNQNIKVSIFKIKYIIVKREDIIDSDCRFNKEESARKSAVSFKRNCVLL